MKFKIDLTKSARKDISGLPSSTQKKISRKIDLLETNPFVGKKLSGHLKGRRSVRAWPYRIIYRLNQTQKTVEVISIAHRQNAYR